MYTDEIKISFAKIVTNLMRTNTDVNWNQKSSAFFFTLIPCPIDGGKEMRKRHEAGGARHQVRTGRGGARRGKMRVYAS